MHGFDEFFGNLYHLNAEEEPEDQDYPKSPSSKKLSARAACCTATPTARAASVDTGPLNKKRMETHRRRDDRARA